jgi:anthranilate phosphoribosyltransferase
MNYATLIRQIEAGEDMSFLEARALLAALLDGGVPELETAALLLALRQHAPGVDAWLGMHAALAERLPDFEAPQGPFRTVVLPAYHGVRAHPHLTPLLALLLRSFNVPVLIHGVLEGGGGTAAAYVLRELGVMPCASVAQVNAQLGDEGLAFAPAALLSPGLASLLALRSRLGVENLATRLAVLVDVLGETSLRVTPVAAADDLGAVGDVLLALGGHALLMQGCEGEAFADPLLRPDAAIMTMGITFTVYSEAGNIDRAWPFDIIPRVMAKKEWTAHRGRPEAAPDGAEPVHQRSLQRAAHRQGRGVPDRSAGRGARRTSVRSARA